MESKKIHINFFFRKSSENFHSIEELFYNIQRFLPDNFTFTNIYLPFHSGFLGRIKNIFFVFKHKSKINHITGDVNYISIGLPKKGTVLTVHDIDSAFSDKRIKQKIISIFWFVLPFRRVKKIIAISEFTKTQILQNFNLDSKKIIVIPNCVSPSFTHQNREFSKKIPIILIVGTKENKNIFTILKALQNIKCSVNILGKLSENQINFFLKYNITYNNFFNLTFDKVVKVYQESDILLFPSLYEGFGMPIIEAQATGIPVITSNIEPMKSVAGNAALLVNPNNVLEIKNALLSIIENEKLRENLVNLGFKNIERYSCKNVANRLSKVYIDIANAK